MNLEELTMHVAIRATILLGISSAALPPIPVSGQEDWQVRVREHLDRASAPVTESGFAPSGSERTGSLAAGASEGLFFAMSAGNEYTLIGVCNSECGDIDLEVYDPAGHEMDSDLEVDDVPIVTVTPDRSADYRVVIGMVECSTDACGYGVRMLVRPAAAPGEHRLLVQEQLQRFDQAMTEQGYQRTHGFRFKALNQAASHEFLVRLKAGTTYGIAGFCDRDCSDLDLAVLGTDGESVVQDVETGDHPAVDLVVTGSGLFRIRVTMAACSAAPCLYGVAVHGRPTRPAGDLHRTGSRTPRHRLP